MKQLTDYDIYSFVIGEKFFHIPNSEIILCYLRLKNGAIVSSCFDNTTRQIPPDKAMYEHIARQFALDQITAADIISFEVDQDGLDQVKSVAAPYSCKGTQSMLH